MEKIKDKLNEVIADIDELRASVQRRKRALLQGAATDAALSELVSLNASLDDLRLTEDVLSDLVTAIEKRADR
jgi:hypothetical protein